MRWGIIVMMIMGIYNSIYSQQIDIERDVVSIAGGYVVSPESMTSVSWTLGEAVIGYHEEGGTSVSAGFQQGGSLKITGITDVEQVVDMAVYPNPTTDILHLSRTENDRRYILSIQNLMGQVIWKDYFLPGELSKSIPMHTYAEGNYFLEVSDDIGKSLRVYNILKTGK